jgi:hypothetical protein
MLRSLSAYLARSGLVTAAAGTLNWNGTAWTTVASPNVGSDGRQNG